MVYMFCLTLNLLKSFPEFQHCEDFYKMKNDLKGHPRSYKTFLSNSFWLGLPLKKARLPASGSQILQIILPFLGIFTGFGSGSL